MKILIITTELYPWTSAGPQIISYNIINRLIEYFDIEVLCVEPPDKKNLCRYYNNKIKFHFVPKAKLPFVYQWSYYRKIKQLGNFDIVHFQNFPGGKMVLLPRFTRKISKKVILTIHDWIPFELKYYKLGNKIQHLIHWRLSNYTLKFFDHLIVMSNFMKETVIKNLHHLTIPISILPIGINVTNYELSNTKNITLEGKINLFFCGRLYEKKGVGNLIRAFKIVSKKNPQIHLYIGGKGELEKEYKSLVKHEGLFSKVHFLGFLNKERLKRYLKSVDICILPSEYEGFGITVLEAMAAGKPVITSNRGGQTDFVKNNANAILTNTLNHYLIAQEILRLIGNEQKLKNLSYQARLTAEKYDWSKLISQYISFYNNLIK